MAEFSPKTCPGMALADIVHEAQRPYSSTYTPTERVSLSPIFDSLKHEVNAAISDQGIQKDRIYYEYYLNMRYQGTETAMMIMETDKSNFKEGFLQRHMQEFNFLFPEDRQILIDDIRVRGIGKSEETLDRTNELSREMKLLSFQDNTRQPDSTVSLRN